MRRASKSSEGNAAEIYQEKEKDSGLARIFLAWVLNKKRVVGIEASG